LKGFFKSSIVIAISDEKDPANLRESILYFENYETLKKLARDELAVFVAKKQRDRFYQVINGFLKKYEISYPNN